MTAEALHLAPGITEEAALAGRIFVRGQGSRIFDDTGRAYIDFGAGILTQSVGHCHPHVTAMVQDQVGRLTNIHDSSTIERDALCRALAAVFPSYLNRFAFFSSGAEAVEAAIRAVYAQATPDRTVIASLRGGFHGKTQGPRSLVKWAVGPEPLGRTARQFHHAHCYKCPLDLTRPDCAIACARQIADAILASDDLAALVFEPIQAAGGVIIPPRDYWRIIADACRAKQVLMIADEIVTAGGRAGTFLACEYYGIEPDLVMAAKGLSSGIPFSMLAGRTEIMCSPRFASAGGTSSTYGGNPVSCAAVSATLDVLRDDNILAGVVPLGDHLAGALAQLKREFPDQIADVRGIGLLHAIEFGHEGEVSIAKVARAARFYQRSLSFGVRVGLGGNIARLAPPLNISVADINMAVAAFHAALTTENN